MRWRATVGLPAKAADTIVSRQCVLPPGAAPAWPACCALSSTRSICVGASAPRRRRISAGTSPGLLLRAFLLLHVAREEHRLREHEQHHQADAADQLELDPGRFLEVVGDVEVQYAHRREEA